MPSTYAHRRFGTNVLEHLPDELRAQLEPVAYTHLISEISNDRVEKVSDVLKVGDMVDVTLLDVDFDKKRISLSMRCV